MNEGSHCYLHALRISNSPLNGVDGLEEANAIVAKGGWVGVADAVRGAGDCALSLEVERIQARRVKADWAFSVMEAGVSGKV